MVALVVSWALDLASWDHVARIRVYPCGILPNAPMADLGYREKWGIQTRAVPLGFQPGDGVTEWIETVVATSTMSEAEHAQAKVFMALVNALELYGLTRSIRTFVGQQLGITPGQFYRALLEHQQTTKASLSGALAGIEGAVLDRTYSDELISSGVTKTHDGRSMHHHKAIAYNVLTCPDVFVQELTSFVRSLGLELPEDLLRFQADQWLLPTYDPKLEYRHQYQVDWISVLAGQVDSGPVEVVYSPRPDLVELGYQPGLHKWLSFVLALNSVDTPCVQKTGVAW